MGKNQERCGIVLNWCTLVNIWKILENIRVSLKNCKTIFLNCLQFLEKMSPYIPIYTIIAMFELLFIFSVI